MNTLRGGRAIHHGEFERILPANNPDQVVVNLNPVDEGSKIGLAKGNLSSRQPLPQG